MNCPLEIHLRHRTILPLIGLIKFVQLKRSVTKHIFLFIISDIEFTGL